MLPREGVRPFSLPIRSSQVNATPRGWRRTGHRALGHRRVRENSVAENRVGQPADHRRLHRNQELPATGPIIVKPRMRSPIASTSNFIKLSVSPVVRVRRTSLMERFATRTAMPRCRASLSLQPTRASGGSVNRQLGRGGRVCCDSHRPPSPYANTCPPHHAPRTAQSDPKPMLALCARKMYNFPYIMRPM